MKIKTLVALGIATLAAGSLHAQGTIDFQPRILGVYDCRVTDESGSMPVLCSGTNYTAQLFVGPLGSSESELILVPGSTSTFRSGVNVGLWNMVLGLPTSVPGGVRATFQVRVWDNLGGRITRYDDAFIFGHSALVDTVEVLGGSGNPPKLPANLLGLTSFSINYIPEPTTAALAGLGLAGLMIFRRRK